MKGKKRYIVLLILISAFGCFLYFTKDKRKEQIKKQDEKIKEENELREKKEIKFTDVTTIDKEKYGEYDLSLGNLLLFKKDKVYYVLNNEGKELYYGSVIPVLIADDDDSKAYYRIANILYDYEGKEVYNKLTDDMEISNIVGKSLIVNADYKIQIIDLPTTDVKNVDNIIGIYGSNYIYVKNKEIYLYNNGEKKFDTIEQRNGNEYVHLKSSTEDVYLKYGKGIITKDEYNNVKLNDKYYIDFENCGQVKTLSDKKSIVDKCFYEYEKVNNKFFVLSSTNGEIYLLRNDNIEKIDGFKNGYVADDVYYASKGNNDDNYYLFYENGDSKEVECPARIAHAGNNVFACYDMVESYFIVDNKIQDEKYDSIECDTSSYYCIVTKDNKDGLYYMGEKIIEPNYIDIIVEHGHAIIDLGNEYNIYYIKKDGKRLKKDDLNPKKEEEKFDIDVDKIVATYNLDKDLVKDNKELFTKYAYIVEHNVNIKNYKAYVYDLFKIVVDEKQYIDEDLFFDSLKKLKIGVKDSLKTDGAAGEYYDDEIEIAVKKIHSNTKNVYYHELVHFLDHRLNNNKANKVLSYNKKNITEEEYRKLSLEEKRKVKFYDNYTSMPYFMVEAGAEIYSSNYFNNLYIISYVEPANIYYILDYLLGEDKMEGVFFGNENFYNLLNGSLTEEEYDKFINAAYNITRIDVNSNYNDRKIIFESLIKIYTNLKGKEWYDDNTFCFLLYSLEHLKLNSIKESKYYNTYEKIQSFYTSEHERLGKQIAALFNEPYVANPSILFKDGSILLQENIFGYKGKNFIVTYKYDSKNKTIKEIRRDEI